jgi:hypothetical protein
MDPITTDNNFLTSYEQVEQVALGFGLAFRSLWNAQFLKKYADVPTHIINSSYQFSKYAQLSHGIEDLLSGYADPYIPLAMSILQLLSDGLLRLKEIEAYTAHNKPSSNEMVVGSGATKDEHATTVPESASTVR